MPRHSPILLFLSLLVAALLVGCGGGAGGAEAGAEAGGPSRSGGPPSGRGGPPGGGRGGRGGPGGFGGGDAPASAIPVEVSPVEVRDISDYLETNGTLEAENEVDLIARITGPIVDLLAEEGMFVQEGQVLARIDDREARAQLEIAKVSLEEARLAYERAQVSWEAEIVAEEVLDLAKSKYDAAAAQIRNHEIQLGYTVIRAPFSGLIIERVIKQAEFVTNGSRLFRLSDFSPLLCEIQVPEKDLGRLRKGQQAHLNVEAFPDVRFGARVLRVNPVVEAETGTVRTTLAVDGQGKLRPGMFASVFLQVDVHEGALVVPKEALVLESIGDTVFVVEGETVVRREVEIGFAESDAVEILSGVSAGESVVVVGQDSLSDGTQVTVLGTGGRMPVGGPGEPPPGAGAQRRGPPPGAQQGAVPSPAAGAEDAPRSPGGMRRGGPPPGFDPTNMTPEMEETIRGRMRQRGLSEEQIEERLEAMREGNFRPGDGPPPGGGAR